MFRFCTIEYANRRDLLAGRGARLNGGRWNPRGLFNCVYGSVDARTAQHEVFASFARYGIPGDKMPPLAQVAIKLRLQSVLDLRANRLLRRLGLRQRDLVECDWQHEQQSGREALTQCLGRLAWESRLEGLLVTSTNGAASGNIVLFPGRRRRGSSWRIQGARQLPRLD